MPHLKLVSHERTEPSAPRYLAPGLRKLPAPTDVERYLLLKNQSRAAPRECMCLALRQGNRWTWQTVRINLTIDGGERDSEVLSLSTDPLTATSKYEHALGRYLASGWFPPGSPTIGAKELAARFVGRWPRIPTMLEYRPRRLLDDLRVYRYRWNPSTLCLRQYSGGRRMLLQVNPDYSLVLSNGAGLREDVPPWMAAGTTTLPMARLPALFEVRLYADHVAFSDLLQAKQDYRLAKFTRRWQILRETLAGAAALWNGARFGFDPLLPVTDLQGRIEYAVRDGYDEMVVHDMELPYYYGEAMDLRPYIAWRKDVRSFS
jgi:hypothetical protein